MSSDVKTTLKEARTLYKENNFMETVKKCKIILKKDKSNYNALVLLGAAMKEIDDLKSQAALVLQKATIVQPENPLAWQGLMNYYEKEVENNNENLSNLVLTYCKLLELDSNSPKFSHILTKVSELSIQMSNENIIDTTIQTLDQLRKNCNQDCLGLVEKKLTWILTESIYAAEKYKSLYEEILANVIDDTNIQNRQLYYKKYLSLLYNSEKYFNVLKASMKLHKEFPSDTCLLEWICRIYNEQLIFHGISCDIAIKHYYESLLKLDESSEIALITKALCLKQSGDLIKSREILINLFSTKSQSPYTWILLTQINFKLYCWESTITSAEKTLILLNSKEFFKLKQEIKILLVESLSRSDKSKHWENGIKICSEMLQKNDLNIQIHLALTRIYISLKNPEAINKLESLECQEEVKNEALILRALHLKKNKHFEEAIDVLGGGLESSEAWLLLGKLYWEMADYNHSLMAFMNSIQIDRYNWESLMYLGNYYLNYSNHIERAKKCYQTALQINPYSNEAGIGLSKVYRILKNNVANLELLQHFTTQGKGTKWAWLQLGLQLLEEDKAPEAIKALQTVIRMDSKDHYCWEALGDAYGARGAFKSALNCYQHVLDLKPGFIYPLLQLANVKLTIGQYEEAIEDYKLLLNIDSTYTSALKGLAETYLSLARENFCKQLLGRVKDNLQNAVDILTRIIMNQAGLCCVWKLLGDSCYLMAKLSEKYCYLRILSALAKSSHESQKEIIIKKKDIIFLALRSYCRALTFTPESALLWHDLACCYYSLSKCENNSESKDALEKCLAAIKYAIKICPSSWMHWNALGIFCMDPKIKNYALSQHCFVMAIDREQSNAIVWTNLGTLYLHLGDIYKANSAFSRAQRADPSYTNSWVGQGIIAEKLGRKEAADLFRHSMQLGYHSQAALSYAHWVLQTLLDPESQKDPIFSHTIQFMHAIPIASDTLSWYIEHNENNPFALNAHGLLLERQKLYRTSMKRLKKALELAEDNHRDAVITNLARIYMHLEIYEEAINLCRNVKKPNFKSQCQLGHALFKAGMYEESYSVYEVTLVDLAKNDTDRSMILGSMATIAYLIQGFEDAKTLYFQCVQLGLPVVECYLAFAAVGILENDFNLSSLILKELTSFENESKYGLDIAILNTLCLSLMNKLGDLDYANKVKKHGLKYLLFFVKILIETNYPISNSLLKTLSSTLAFEKSLPDFVDITTCQLLLSSLSKNYEYCDLYAIQKQLFAFPHQRESWINLLIGLSLRNSKDDKLSIVRLKRTLSTIRGIKSSDARVEEWLSDCERKLNDLEYI